MLILLNREHLGVSPNEPTARNTHRSFIIKTVNDKNIILKHISKVKTQFRVLTFDWKRGVIEYLNLGIQLKVNTAIHANIDVYSSVFAVEAHFREPQWLHYRSYWFI